jgi:hypothetical protein
MNFELDDVLGGLKRWGATTEEAVKVLSDLGFNLTPEEYVDQISRHFPPDYGADVLIHTRLYKRPEPILADGLTADRRADVVKVLQLSNENGARTVDEIRKIAGKSDVVGIRKAFDSGKSLAEVGQEFNVPNPAEIIALSLSPTCDQLMRRSAVQVMFAEIGQKTLVSDGITVLQDFIDACCGIDPTAKIPFNVFYDAFQAWLGARACQWSKIRTGRELSKICVVIVGRAREKFVIGRTLCGVKSDYVGEVDCEE